jgi:hypothetical protein
VSVLNQLEAGWLSLDLGGPATQARGQRQLRGIQAHYRHGVASALVYANRATRPVIGEWSPWIVRCGTSRVATRPRGRDSLDGVRSGQVHDAPHRWVSLAAAPRWPR